MANPFVVIIGKIVRACARARSSGTGGGSALPGLVVERLSPRFAVKILSSLPYGVVLISGTNGKTTTTKIVSELFEAHGLRVFTNTSGSNFMRGVISSLLGEVTLTGRLNADIAVLELDEAHAVGFARALPPRYTLLLNVMRDQLDRFGEIDHTADLLAVAAVNTTGALVLNREDVRLAAIPKRAELVEDVPDDMRLMTKQGEMFTAAVHWFGASPALATIFSQDDEEKTKPAVQADVVLESLKDTLASYAIAGANYSVDLQLKGVYNAYNAAAALALVHVVLEHENLPTATQPEISIEALSMVRSAFGRGETISLDGREIEVQLVKNPDGFRLALESYDASNCATMIALTDAYADGRDVGWLYDVSFTSLQQTGVAMASGVRAYDMALRLAYDDVVCKAVVSDLAVALDDFLANNPKLPCRIYCTYSAMLVIRKQLLDKVKAKAKMSRKTARKTSRKSEEAKT